MMSKTNLPQDANGVYRSDCGWETKPSGGYRQRRFYLGTDPNAALGRLAKVREAWACLEARWKRRPAAERPLWNADQPALAIARAAARGEEPIMLELGVFDPAIASEVLGQLRQDFPAFRLELVGEIQQKAEEERPAAGRFERCGRREVDRPP